MSAAGPDSVPGAEDPASPRCDDSAPELESRTDRSQDELSLWKLLDEIRVLASNGLLYSKDPYDRERYTRLLELAEEEYSRELGTPHGWRERFARELGHITPKVGADAAIVDTRGRILLVRRAEEDTWCLPCGWVEPGEAPDQTAVRETREETGLEVEITGLVGVFHRFPGVTNGPHAVVSIVYRARPIGGRLRPSAETPQVAYRRIDEVRNWHRNHEILARAALRAEHGGAPIQGP